MQLGFPTLPVTLPPFPDETIDSYLERLRAANHVGYSVMRRYLGLRVTSNSRTRFHLTADDLASLTGYPTATLTWALPELRWEQEPKRPTKRENDRALRLRKSTGHACALCAATKGIFEKVTVWEAPDRQVCVRHRVWVGDLAPYQPGRWLDLSSTPEIVRAAALADRLSRRHGRDRVVHCLDEAKQILGRRAKPDKAQVRLQSILFRTHQDLGSHSYLVISEAANYPQRVALAALLLSPYWRGLGSSAQDADTARFQNQLAQRVWPGGLDSYKPLHDWMRYQRQRKRHTHGRERALFPIWLPERSAT